MTESHTITPTPELVQQWVDLLPQGSITAFTAAAQWGADIELEACCEWIPKWTPWDADQLRAARRPKPPSLKEQAQQSLLRLANYSNNLMAEDAADMETIRRALEALPE
jgi:hypothetical protein